MNNIGIFKFLVQKADAGVRVALVTLTQLQGGSMRDPGAHMAVAEDGDWHGSLSGGCIEAAVAADARAAIAEGTPRQVRFGSGSPYLDIRLPCGGTLDILINPIGDARFAERATTLFDARVPFVISLPLSPGKPSIREDLPEWRTVREHDVFCVSQLPPLAILIAGHGAVVEMLEALGSAAGAVTRVLTPDREIVARLAARGSAADLLRAPGDTIDLVADPWTAIAFLFHDHDWETALIAEALAGPAFYVGAMGSFQTQVRRAGSLRDAGVSTDRMDRLRAPIGVIPASRDPSVLAVSVLAQIVQEFAELTAPKDSRLPRSRQASYETTKTSCGVFSKRSMPPDVK